MTEVVVYFPDTEVVSIGGESAKSAGKLTDSGRQLSALQVESELLYFRKHYGLRGIAMRLLLVMLGDVILVLKDFVKGRWGGIPLCWKNHALTWRLFRATKWATSAMLNNIGADLAAYEGNWGAQGFWVMVVYRFGRWRYTVSPAVLRKFFSLVYKLVYKLVQILDRDRIAL